MSRRSLMGLAGLVLLVAAATTIDTPQVVWKLAWPVRLGIGGVGVLLVFGALLVGPGARELLDRDRPSA
jgi:hypothetical protein